MAGLVLLAALAAAALLFLRDTPQVAELPNRPRGPSPAVDTREQDAARLLRALVDGLRTGEKADVTALAVPGDRSASRQLAAIYDNVHKLRITDLSMRYVDEDAGRISDPRRNALGGRAWVGQVQLTWRIRRFDATASQLEVPLTFVMTPEGTALARVRARAGDQIPLWLLGRLAVGRTSRTLVIAADARQLESFSTLARQAVRDVAAVLPRWQGDLVVQVPSSQRQLNHALGSGKDQYSSIAAVTTTPDGSSSQGATAHVFINPPVFNPLGERGSQIVMSHEAAHVATGAATASMPAWLLEGFADYVALARVDLPVSVTASQILGHVRESGPPSRLPGATQFDPSHAKLGASYEAAWLACRLIAETYGERRLVRFYRHAESAGSAAEAFRDVLGTSPKRFTQQWRDYLRGLAQDA